MAITGTDPDVDTDPTTVALAAMDATPGLVEQTGPDAFTKRAIGVGDSTSIPTRADGDARWAAADADLLIWAGLTPSANFQTLVPQTFAQMRTSLSVVPGTDVQAFSAILAAIVTAGIAGVASGYLFGMTMSNNGSDATNDINIAAGKCVDSTGASFFSGGALTKQLDAAWAAGNAAGGRMSAAAIANTTYHVFAIQKTSDGTIDYGFDTSAIAPTMPSGYTLFRRIGSILRESAAIVPFVQIGDRFDRKVPTQDVNTNNPGTSAITSALKVPLGISVEALINVTLLDVTPAANTLMLVTALDQTDTDPGAGAGTITLAVFGDATKATIRDSGGGDLRVRTNTSGQIRYRLTASTADHNVFIQTNGWIDTRGRLA